MRTEPIAPGTGEAGKKSGVNPNVDALRRVPIFAHLENDALVRLAEHCRRRRFDTAEESLFHEGDDPGSLYIILVGTVHIRSVTPTGKTVHIAERGVGDQIGELSLLDNAPRMADAVTASPCELLVLGQDAFTRCIEEYPKIALAVMRSLAGRLREAARHLALQEEQDIAGRLSRLLLDHIDSRAPATGEVRLTRRQTHQQMADQIGAARESVSRALSDFRRLNIVRMQGREIVIVDLEKLRRQAERS